MNFTGSSRHREPTIFVIASAAWRSMTLDFVDCHVACAPRTDEFIRVFVLGAAAYLEEVFILEPRAVVVNHQLYACSLPDSLGSPLVQALAMSGGGDGGSLVGSRINSQRKFS